MFQKDIHKAFYPKNLKILVAKYGENLITGTIDVYYRDRTYSWIGSPKPYFKIPNANELLTWESLKYASESGYNYYEIIGVATTEGLYKHYSRLNPNISAYFSAIKRNSLSKILESSYTNILKPIRSKRYLKNGH